MFRHPDIETVSEDADVIFGLVHDEAIGLEFQVNVIATFPKEDMIKNLTFMREIL